MHFALEQSIARPRVSGLVALQRFAAFRDSYLSELCQLTQLGGVEARHLAQLSELSELVLASSVCSPQSLLLMLAHALVLGSQLAVKVHVVWVQAVGQIDSWHQRVIV